VAAAPRPNVFINLAEIRRMAEHRFLLVDDVPTVESRFTFLGGHDPERFFRALVRVLSFISPAEKRCLERLLRPRRRASFIVVENAVILRVETNGRWEYAAGTTENITTLHFAGWAFLEMTNVELETLIAHEIAHAVLNAEADQGQLPPVERAAWDALAPDAAAITQWHETYADARTLRWNAAYNSQHLRDWLREYWSRKQLPLRPL
jgi:hypothetical protein